MIRMSSIELHTKDAEEDDIESFRVRISKEAMEKLGIDEGDVVSISGQKTTVAIARQPLRPMENNQIAINPRILKNAGVYDSGIVEVSKEFTARATSVNFTPAGFSVTISSRFHDYIKRELLNCPVVLHDLVIVPILARSHPFKVTNVEPKGSVIISKNTNLFIEKSLEVTYERDFVEYNDPSYFYIEMLKSKTAIARLRRRISSGEINQWLDEISDSIDAEEFKSYR